MSHYSAPANNLFSTPPIQTGGVNRERQSLSHSEHPSMKKQRVCEALVVLNPRVPVMANNIMTPTLVNGRTWNGGNGVAAMQLCRMFYYKRKCAHGDRCRFSHVNPETVEQDLGRLGQSASKESPKSAMWKTKLCKKWEMTGGCLYGNTCYFAHGQAELRKLGRRNASASRIAGINVSNSFSIGSARSGITCKQGLQGESCVFNRKSLKKISGIYADWIEGKSLLQSSFEQVENQVESD